MNSIEKVEQLKSSEAVELDPNNVPFRNADELGNFLLYKGILSGEEVSRLPIIALPPKEKGLPPRVFMLIKHVNGRLEHKALAGWINAEYTRLGLLPPIDIENDN